MHREFYEFLPFYFFFSFTKNPSFEVLAKLVKESSFETEIRNKKQIKIVV